MESIKIAKDSELVTMLVFDDVDSIVGVDERVYGPFRPQDLVVLPKINAKIFVKNQTYNGSNSRSASGALNRKRK